MTEQKRNYFSREGMEYYTTVLADLRARATAHGKEVGEEAGINCDWHDNFGFEEARRNLEKASRRAMDLQNALSSSEIIQIIEQSVRVAIGSTIVVGDDNGDGKEYTIGAWGESDPKNGLVSYTAPVARALIGKKVGDTGKYKAEGTEKELEVVDIHPASYKYRQLIANLFAKPAENQD